jgi:uncharacterized glyoxalase superfamily protein PhnB
MTKKPLTIGKIAIIAQKFNETVAFYQLLGLDIPHIFREPADTRHALVNNGATDLSLDNDALARLYDAQWRAAEPGRSVLLIAQCGTREEVDTIYQRMIAAGYASAQVPYDAFWGSRFAIVVDPEGNPTGLESPSDDTFRSWPPIPSPDE